MSITFHHWTDSGGEYATVIHDTGDAVEITLISDDATVCDAQRVDATNAQIRWIATEWQLADDYAACHYSEVREDIGNIPDLACFPEAYLIVSGGRMYTIPSL